MRNKLYVLDLGRMQMARSSFFGDIAKNDPQGKEMLTFPVSAYLIDGPQGRVLYDTGCHPDGMKPQGRWSESFQLKFPWSTGPDGEACHLPNRLEQMGLGPDDINHVVLSHMHSDHAGCVEFFQKSQVIVHRNEYDAALDYHKRKDPDSSYAWKDTEQWISQNMNWRFIEDHEKELSLTEKVTLLNWGAGHSAGMLGLDLSLDDTGHVILVSDAILRAENYERPVRPPGFSASTINAARTVETIRTRAERLNAQVWFGHDMKQFTCQRHSSEGWYE
ncbi:MAG: N-acyl homoserine lactonase family protein [Desulfobacterales bacterium]